MTITFFESVMQAATDVHCNKRKRVDSVGDDSVGQLPTNLVTATPPRIVKADFFQAHTQQHTLLHVFHIENEI